MSQTSPVNLPVRVLDVQHARTYQAVLRQDESGFVLARNAEPEAPTDLYLSPGWIDLHAHVYHGVTSLSLDPDSIGLSRGVHLVADAGSAGEATLPGLVRFVAPTSRTGVRAWLNISSQGLVTMREYYDLALLDPARTAAVARAHPGIVRGIKVRSSGLIVGQLGLQPLKLARLAARTAGLPLLVHVGEPPPLIEEILDLLDAGDVVTHCYHAKLGGPWRPDGQPIPALRRAIERGVRLDVGHGAASFSFEVAERAIAAGYRPHSISTDLHVRNVNGPVHDLPTTMSKLLAVGMHMEEVVRAVTQGAAEALREPDWCDLGGPIRHATLFHVASPREAPIGRDATGAERALPRKFEPVAVITAEGLRWLAHDTNTPPELNRA